MLLPLLRYCRSTLVSTSPPTIPACNKFLKPVPSSHSHQWAKHVIDQNLWSHSEVVHHELIIIDSGSRCASMKCIVHQQPEWNDDIFLHYLRDAAKNYIYAKTMAEIYSENQYRIHLLHYLYRSHLQCRIIRHKYASYYSQWNAVQIIKML